MDGGTNGAPTDSPQDDFPKFPDVEPVPCTSENVVGTWKLVDSFEPWEFGGVTGATVTFTYGSDGTFTEGVIAGADGGSFEEAELAGVYTFFNESLQLAVTQSTCNADASPVTCACDLVRTSLFFGVNTGPSSIVAKSAPLDSQWVPYTATPLDASAVTTGCWSPTWMPSSLMGDP